MSDAQDPRHWNGKENVGGHMHPDEVRGKKLDELLKGQDDLRLRLHRMQSLMLWMKGVLTPAMVDREDAVEELADSRLIIADLSERLKEARAEAERLRDLMQAGAEDFSAENSVSQSTVDYVTKSIAGFLEALLNGDHRMAEGCNYEAIIPIARSIVSLRDKWMNAERERDEAKDLTRYELNATMRASRDRYKRALEWLAEQITKNVTALAPDVASRGTIAWVTAALAAVDKLANRTDICASCTYGPTDCGNRDDIGGGACGRHSLKEDRRG